MATVAFAADWGTEELAIPAASTQATKGMCERICEQPELRKSKEIAGVKSNITSGFAARIKAKARRIKKLSASNKKGPLPT